MIQNLFIFSPTIVEHVEMNPTLKRRIRLLLLIVDSYISPYKKWLPSELMSKFNGLDGFEIQLTL